MSGSREDVVREALRWEGTPYHSHARLLGVGVDCAQLPAAVYEAAGLIEHVEPVYTRQWYMHHDEERFLSWIRPRATEISREEVGPGDLAVWRFGRTYSHSGIFISPPVVMHAWAHSGRVERADADQDVELLSRPVLYFTLWESSGGR